MHDMIFPFIVNTYLISKFYISAASNIGLKIYNPEYVIFPS